MNKNSIKLNRKGQPMRESSKRLVTRISMCMVLVALSCALVSCSQDAENQLKRISAEAQMTKVELKKLQENLIEAEQLNTWLIAGTVVSSLVCFFLGMGMGSKTRRSSGKEHAQKDLGHE